MEVEQFQVTCKNNQKVKWDKRLKPFILLWAEIYDDEDDVVDFLAEPEIVDLINQFYWMHDYKKEAIFFVYRIEDANILSSMDEASLKFLEKHFGYRQDWQKQEVIEYSRRVGRLLDESSRLRAQEVIEIVNISIAWHFYIGGVSEKEFQAFSQKWGVQYPLAPTKQRQIVEDNKVVFERLSNLNRQNSQANG